MDVDRRELDAIADQLGHGSIKTTERYLGWSKTYMTRLVISSD